LRARAELAELEGEGPVATVSAHDEAEIGEFVGAPAAGGREERRRTMVFRIRRADYYYATVEDLPERGTKVLADLAAGGVNLLAFTAVPIGPTRTQLTLFAEDDATLEAAARHCGLAIDGPHPALLVQGDDELGALARIHALLARADVEVFASTGVTDGRGAFGYVLYVRPADVSRAESALGL
jgi:hypothetical protein